MSRITDVPTRVSNAGQEFNYDIWSANTRVTLCNVQWDSTYRDIVGFDDKAALDAYIDAQPNSKIVLDKVARLNPGTPIRLSVPYNKALNFNYIRVDNPLTYNDDPRSFYYFIMDVGYVANMTTNFIVMLDVWQTFGRDVEFGRSYVERGHIAVANENADQTWGNRFLTVPEGLDLGNEFTITKTTRQTIASNFNPQKPCVIVSTTVSFEGSGGSVDDPVIKTARGSKFENLPNGVEQYLFLDWEYQDFLRYTADKPWVTQGIISAQAVPYLNPTTDVFTTQVLMEGGYPVKRLNEGIVKNRKYQLVRDVHEVEHYLLPDRYKHLTKFCTYPYSAIEVTTYSGTPLVLKPERIATRDLDVVRMMHLSIPGARIAFYPYKYNSYDGVDADVSVAGQEFYNDNAEFLDMVTGILDLPTFSVVNNSYMAFLASNKNSIAYQHSSADWSQQRTGLTAGLSYDQAGASMGTQRQQTEIGLSAQNQQVAMQNDFQMLGAAAGAAQGIAGGIAGGPAGIAAGVAGGAGGLAGAALANAQRTAGNDISQSAARQTLRSQQNLSGYMRNSNYDMAMTVARGDYAQQIAGINAKVQDAKMIQPTTAGQVGGDAFNLALYEWAIHAKVKRVNSGVMRVIGEYWLRYGYALNHFVTPPSGLHCMTKFTYWKMLETYIRSSTCPEQFKQSIRGIFEKGVTVWKNPNDIGFIDTADNQPIGGIAL